MMIKYELGWPGTFWLEKVKQKDCIPGIDNPESEKILEIIESITTINQEKDVWLEEERRKKKGYKETDKDKPNKWIFPKQNILDELYRCIAKYRAIDWLM